MAMFKFIPKIPFKYTSFCPVLIYILSWILGLFGVFLAALTLAGWHPILCGIGTGFLTIFTPMVFQYSVWWQGESDSAREEWNRLMKEQGL